MVEFYRERVRAGKMNPERAALGLATLCPCGIFNHVCGAKLLAGDDDGAVIVRLDSAGEVLRLAQAREARKRVMIEQLRAGKSTMELLGINQLQ